MAQSSLNVVFLFLLSFHLKFQYLPPGKYGTQFSDTVTKLAIMSPCFPSESLTSPVHFCLNGQGNQPELMSYVLVLVSAHSPKVKIKVVQTCPLKEVLCVSFRTTFLHNKQTASVSKN